MKGFTRRAWLAVSLLLCVGAALAWRWSYDERDELGWTGWIARRDGNQFRSFVGLVSGNGRVAIDFERHDGPAYRVGTGREEVAFNLTRQPDPRRGRSIVPERAREAFGFFAFDETERSRTIFDPTVTDRVRIGMPYWALVALTGVAPLLAFRRRMRQRLPGHGPLRMYCALCGNQIGPVADRCPKCGAPARRVG